LTTGFLLASGAGAALAATDANVGYTDSGGGSTATPGGTVAYQATDSVANEVTVSVYNSFFLDATTFTQSGLTCDPAGGSHPCVYFTSTAAGGLSVYPPCVVYQKWEPTTAHRQSLDQLVGRSRAAVLRRLADPATTSQLAAELRLGIGTVGDHLVTLRDNRLVTRTRAGRKVLYARTPLADSLVEPGDG
jgi:hypothetical protein